MNNKKTVLSGIKPTGRPHIGNYFGAMQQFVKLQDEYHCLFMIADLHALTTLHDAKLIKENTFDLALDYLAIGLDPQKVILFKQSDIPAHTELAWVLECVTTMPFLMRAHAFKDAEAKNKEISVGTFNYPMLMAADILLYDTDLVPVGQDQKQHIEYTRDSAEKFNKTFGQLFKLPQPLILEEVATIPGLDGQKMSKSYNNTIPLFSTDEEIKKLVMKIVTDSKTPTDKKDPKSCNIFALHKLFSLNQLSEIEDRYKTGKISYKESKEILIENIISFITPLREKRDKLSSNPKLVKEIINDGSNKAKEIADKKLKEIKKTLGLHD